MQYIENILYVTYEATTGVIIDSIMAVSTVVIAAFTIYLAFENRALRKAGLRPHLVAYLSWNPRHDGAVELVIANVGQGPAFNVAVSLVDYDRTDFANHDVTISEDHIRQPMSALPQGEYQRFMFGITYVLWGNPDAHGNVTEPLKPFTVRLSCTNLLKEKKEIEFTLDIRQFAGFSKYKPNDKSLKEIKDLSRDIKNTNREIVQYMKINNKFIQKYIGENKRD